MEYCTPQHWFEHMFEWEDAALGTYFKSYANLGSEQEVGTRSCSLWNTDNFKAILQQNKVQLNRQTVCFSAKESIYQEVLESNTLTCASKRDITLSGFQGPA